MSHVTTVGSSPSIILGEVWLNFVIKSDIFLFEANVIKDLIHDHVLARDFRQKCCSKLDFIEKVVEFSHPEDPLSRFLMVLVIIWMLKLMLIAFHLYISITLLLILRNLQ